MADTGANSCLTDSEHHLVRCTEIPPVTVGLALKDDTNGSPKPFTCRRMGFLLMLQEDNTYHYQPFLIHPQATNTIMSPEAVMNASSVFKRFAQTGVKGHSEGLLSFYDAAGDLRLKLPLTKRNGLYYSPIDSLVKDSNGVRPSMSTAAINRHMAGPSPTLPPPMPCIAEEDAEAHVWAQCGTAVPKVCSTASGTTDDKPPRHSVLRKRPSNPAKQLEAELWAARLGYCGEWQLSVLPGGADGIPNEFEPHPFCFVDMKEQARVRKQNAGRKAERLATRGQRFYADFGFLRSSTEC